MENRDSSERPHERLEVWKDAMSPVEAIYRISAVFPDSERINLSSPTGRAAISVPSNVAEGAARKSTAEYPRFLSMARGSLSELDTQLQIVERLGYTSDPQDTAKLLDRVFAKLNGLIRSIQTKPRSLMQRHIALLRIPNPQSRLSTAERLVSPC